MTAQNLRLLIVEDNDLDVIMAERLLRRLKIDVPVIRARNGEEALALLRPTDGGPGLELPFIMLLDINMPRMSGFELLAELSGEDLLKQIPIYIVSTSSRPQDRELAASYCVSGYLEKPLTEESLLAMFRHYDSDTRYDDPTD